MSRMNANFLISLLIATAALAALNSSHGYINKHEHIQLDGDESIYGHSSDIRHGMAPKSRHRREANIIAQLPQQVSNSMTRSIDSELRSAAAGFKFDLATEPKLDLSNALDRNLSLLLDRLGPDMRPSRDYKDFKDISMELSQRAWELFHEHTKASIERRVDLAWPILLELMIDARVSPKCERSIRITLENAKAMKSWAVKLLNSWGSWPMSAIFEGTYGDVGAFHTCVGISQKDLPIGHAHYCSVTFRPVMPSRPDYDLIVRHESDDLVELFERKKWTNNRRSDNKKDDIDRDAFSDLLEHSQYHHFVYYKVGTCWPIDCSPFDVRRITRLVIYRIGLMNGPVKCYSLNASDYEEPGWQEPQAAQTKMASRIAQDWIEFSKLNATRATNQTSRVPKKLQLSVWDKNEGIFIWKPHFNQEHKIALGIIAAVVVFISLMSLIDLFVIRAPRLWRNLNLALRARPLSCKSNQLEISKTGGGGLDQLAGRNQFCLIASREIQQELGEEDSEKGEPSLFMSFVVDCSLFTNVPQFFQVSKGQMRNDILCLNGIRCITMIWIIMTHTMMYNDWSAFARTRAVEDSLNSLISQPLFNGSYLVDTFFLMSGLLSAFTAFKHSQGIMSKFNSIAFILGRWLRLTPQIFIVSMIFIVFPALSYGPHWFPMVGGYSENCVENWWINVLHIQSFYKKEKMCNFVTWWISIDFFYHFYALVVIWIILLSGHKFGFGSIAAIIGSHVAWQSYRHYDLELPPNVLSTIPQSGAMWTTMTLGFFWTPYTHSVPFFFGFYTGYLMALKKKLIVRSLNTRRALIGWILSVSLLIGQSYSTYWWVTGKASYSPLVSTIYCGACSIIWAASLCWIIIACHYGYGGFVNTVLSWKVFIILGKASYLIYLTHFHVLFIFFGNQNLLLEPTTLVMVYIIIGNIFISTIWGVFLCSIFELPWLKAQRRLMTYV